MTEILFRLDWFIDVLYEVHTTSCNAHLLVLLNESGCVRNNLRIILQNLNSKLYEMTKQNLSDYEDSVRSVAGFLVNDAYEIHTLLLVDYEHMSPEQQSILYKALTDDDYVNMAKRLLLRMHRWNDKMFQIMTFYNPELAQEIAGDDMKEIMSRA